MAGELVFTRLSTGSGELRFGVGSSTGAAPDADLALDAIFADDMRASIGVARGAALGIDATFAGDMQAAVGLAWDANVSRDLITRARPSWQDAAPRAPALRVHWQDAAALSIARAMHWQRAAALAGGTRAHWQASLGLHAGTRALWQLGLGATAALRAPFEEARALRAGARTHWQRAADQSIAARLAFEQALALTRAARAHWQPATPLLPWWALHNAPAIALPTAWRPHWQEAWLPRPGGTVRLPPQPPDKPICYDPARLGQLVFRQRAGTTQHGTLFFICTRSSEPPGPPAGRWIIPVLEVYMSAHNLSAVSMPSLEPVVLLDASIESDDGGFCWALSATGREHLMDQLAPVAGLPARVRVTVDGHAWVFAIERISRTRRFGQHRAAIQGRSLTALVGDPYFPAQDFASAADITAHQALIGALDLTGVGITWDVADWLMPGGVWQYNGTPLAAALRLAESAGNVLRSHATDAQLIMAPGYTAMPWDWASATPDVSMPADIILTDSLEPDPSPEYNAVYVSGQQSGVLGHVVRTGTAGDLIAPPVTDPYITHAEAARMRGQRILGAAGRRMTQTITAPFLTDAWAPGPILPGYLVQVTDIGETWRGLVRGIRISASMTTVRQQITIERRTT